MSWKKTVRYNKPVLCWVKPYFGAPWKDEPVFITKVSCVPTGHERFHPNSNFDIYTEAVPLSVEEAIMWVKKFVPVDFTPDNCKRLHDKNNNNGDIWGNE